MALPGPDRFSGPSSSRLRPASGHFEARLAERPEWAALYDSKDWVAMAEGYRGCISEAQQRKQFLTFFPAMHPLRYRPSASIPLFDVIQAVRHALQKYNAATWFRVLRKLRTRCAFRRRIKSYLVRLREQREAVLEEWLGFWNATEARATVELRRQLQAQPLQVASPRLQAKSALRRSMVVTPDALKVEVLWQLFWLLHTQVAQKARLHHERWRWLVSRREELLHNRGQNYVLDFSSEQPQTLRAVNAALFVHALQRPRDPFPSGREVTFREMLRLADFSHALPDWVELKSTASITSTTAGFLTSPLCSDPDWMVSRYSLPYPLIPRCTWTPEARPPLMSPRLGAPSPRQSSPALLDDTATDVSRDRRDSHDPPPPGAPFSPRRTPSPSNSSLRQRGSLGPLSSLCSPGHSRPSRLTVGEALRDPPAMGSRRTATLPKGRMSLPRGPKPLMALPGLPRAHTEPCPVDLPASPATPRLGPAPGTGPGAVQLPRLKLPRSSLPPDPSR
eukprot:EG_transcript_5016